MNKKRPFLLVSACLCGLPCRYDGKNCLVEDLARLYAQGRALAVCPEVEGGLEAPRLPCELLAERVFDCSGRDLTGNFVLGAQKTLQLARRHGISLAVLKERSPSCGSSVIYDGSFSGKRIPGQGVTAALLTRAGIQICNELEYLEQPEIAAALAKLG